ncbi:hypothetical protein ONZ51_g461 [Trametes cubensis]|uniref:Protein kinase domain-containing protein n=1 Tax=Trametes cubensis TaxID=1111947 RepID=A0AAD7XGU1_9APHY|nr:hypothetical protein ONZ51_g461 [Trametes cubensis]
MFMLIPDAEEPAESSSGFAYATPERGLGPGIGSVIRIFEYQALNPLCRPARTRAGFDVVIRVLAIGQSGQDHVEILNALTRGDFAFFSANHAIPLYEFITFEDITFGIFPMVGSRVEEAYGYWAKNSVGDVVDMLLQCLEALLFIHSAKIAHRDAFKDNFLVQWHPESLLIGYPSSSRPRVYLTDFETAMKFPNGTPAAECLASGIPMGSSFPEDVSRYKRPVTPDMGAGQQYDPFKLDVWQLAMSFKNFQKYRFTQSGVTYVGQFSHILETVTGLKYVVRFSDNTTFPADPPLCHQVAEGTPISATGPGAQQKRPSAQELAFVRSPRYPPPGSFPR